MITMKNAMKTSPAVKAARAAAAKKQPRVIVMLIEYRIEPAQLIMLEEVMEELRSYGSAEIIDTTIVQGTV